MVIDLVSMSTATLHLGMCLEYRAFSFCLGIVQKTTPSFLYQLKCEHSIDHISRLEDIAIFFLKGAKKWDGNGCPSLYIIFYYETIS